jgi:hypothetical protein
MATSRKPNPRRTGRPSKYSTELTAVICKGLAEGKSLRSILAELGMPDRMTIIAWLAKYPDFLAHYAHAREVGLDHFAEVTLAEATNVDPDRVQSARLTWDARRWHLSKMMPKRYGERVATEVSGPNGGPIQAQPVAPPMVPREVALAVRRLIAGAEVAVGLPAGSGTDAERLRAVLATGNPLDPDTCEAIYGSGGGGK